MERGKKRGCDSDLALDLESEREMRRQLQKKLDTLKNRYKTTVGELQATVRSLQENLTQATIRADEAQLRATQSARLADEANFQQHQALIVHLAPFAARRSTTITLGC